jgi:CdiI N-terminal domain
MAIMQAELRGRGGVFAIEVQSRAEAGGEGDGSAEAFGRIVIGDFRETFVVPLGLWGESDYRASWRAFEVLEGDPRAVACLMTSMTDPVASNFLICWPVYREGADVYVQNAIVLLDEIEGPFDPWVPWGSPEPRRGMDEDGNRISEWATSMGSLREFFG